MEAVFRISAVAITATVCTVAIRKAGPEIAVVIPLAAAGILLFIGMEYLGESLSLLLEICTTVGLSDELLIPLLKVTGISMVTCVTAALCRDGGESGIAACVETAGTILALWISIPLFEHVLSLILKLM